MEQKIDLTGINPQTLDPKQEKELFASLSDEELADVAGGSYVRSGHVCGSKGWYENLEDAKFDFEVGTRVQVRRAHQVWRSWSATIIGRKPKYEFVYGTGMRYVPYYKVHFDGYNDSYDDWVEQPLLYI